MQTISRIIQGLALLALASTLNHPLSSAQAQGTAITYQGQLSAGGGPANGLYDFSFGLYSAISGGSQHGTTLTTPAVGVTNGLFTVTLDFGGQFNGSTLWLDISVRTNGAASYTPLSQRQLITPVPYAITAESLDTLLPAGQLSGTLANSQLANSSVTVGAGTGLSGGGTVSLGGTTTLNNAGVLSVTGNSDITATTLNGAVTLGDTATSASAANTIVKRDASGSFAAGTVTLGTLNVPNAIIYAGSSTLFHTYGTDSLFAGLGAGNLAITGAGGNTGVGYLALRANTSGAFNTANGKEALYANSSGSFNTASGYGALFNTMTGTNNIGLGYQAGLNTTGSSDIDIGNLGVSGESSTIRIGTPGTHLTTYLAGTVNIGTLSTPNTASLVVSGDDSSSYADAKQITIQGNSDSRQQLELGYKTSGNYGVVQAIQQGVGYKTLALNPLGGTVGIGTALPRSTLDVVGSVSAFGALRLGSETTADPPSYPPNSDGSVGLVVRRISSIGTTAGRLVARTDLLQLQRDGTVSGLQLAYPVCNHQTINAFGITANGSLVTCIKYLTSATTAGTLTIFSDSQRVVHYDISFGNTYTHGHTCHVVLDRYDDSNTGTTSDNDLVGTVTSSYNQ